MSESETRRETDETSREKERYQKTKMKVDSPELFSRPEAGEKLDATGRRWWWWRDCVVPETRRLEEKVWSAVLWRTYLGKSLGRTVGAPHFLKPGFCVIQSELVLIVY